MERSEDDLMEDLVATLIQNIQEDRQAITRLIAPILEEIHTNQGNVIQAHKIIGKELSKYFEILLKTNEQLIKVVKTLNDVSPDEVEEEDVSFSHEEIQELYDEIET